MLTYTRAGTSEAMNSVRYSSKAGKAWHSTSSTSLLPHATPLPQGEEAYGASKASKTCHSTVTSSTSLLPHATPLPQPFFSHTHAHTHAHKPTRMDSSIRTHMRRARNTACQGATLRRSRNWSRRRMRGRKRRRWWTRSRWSDINPTVIIVGAYMRPD